MTQTPLQKFTLDALYQRSIESFAQETIFTSPTQSFTYAQLDQIVQNLQESFKAKGIRQGDKVALLSENLPHWGMVYLAITTMGAIAVPILADFHNSQIRHIIRNSQAKGLIFSSKKEDVFEDNDNDDSFENLHFLMNIESLNFLENDFHPKLEKMKSIDKILKDISPYTSEEISEDDVAVIIYTSGTSGHSKGVMLSHKNLVSNADATKCVYQVTPEDRFLSILPLAHTFECTVGFLLPFMNGASVDYLSKVPTPTALKKALQKVKPTCMLSVPLVIEKIYKNNIQAKFDSNTILKNIYKVPYLRKRLNKIAGKKLIETFGGALNFFAVGGAPLSAQVESFLIETDFPYLIGYGLTETSPLVAAAHPSKRKFRSTGPTITDVTVSLLNKNETSGEGELLVKGPNVMLGYYNDDNATKEAFHDGWFRTGDLASIDDDGYIFIQGRSKNMILGPSGENIYPEQIESVILSSEFVIDALVYESEGKIVAKVHLDYEKLDHAHNDKVLDLSQEKKLIEDLLEKIKDDTNKELSKFSKISKFLEQQEPFEKTPTKKIKRYLYV